MPSKSIKNSRRSNVGFCMLPVKVPRSKRLYKMQKPSRSQKSTLRQLRDLLKNKNRAPVSSSPGKSCSTRVPSPSKLILILTGSLHKKILEGSVNMQPPQIMLTTVCARRGRNRYLHECEDLEFAKKSHQV